MSKPKIKIADLIETQKISGVIAQAVANLEKDAGNPRNAVMFVHVSGDDKVGTAIALNGDTDPTEPLTTAIESLFSKGFNSGNDYVMVSIVLIENARYGQANTPTIDFDNYLVEED